MYEVKTGNGHTHCIVSVGNMREGLPPDRHMTPKSHSSVYRLRTLACLCIRQGLGQDKLGPVLLCQKDQYAFV